MRGYAVFLVLLFAALSAAVGCPICDSPTGEAVRAEIFGSSFGRTFLEVAAPFPVLAVILYVLNRYLPE